MQFWTKLQEKLLVLNVNLPEGLKWIFFILIKTCTTFSSLHFFDHHHFPHFFSFFISSLNFNFLFLITSSSDVRFTVRQFLWLTHSVDFKETIPDSRIHHFVLHIFLRTISGSMKENLCFLCLDYISIGALKLEMRSVFSDFSVLFCNFQYLLRINWLACN